MTRASSAVVVWLGALAAVGCSSSVSVSDAGADASTMRDVSQVCGTAQGTLALRFVTPGVRRWACSVVVRLDQATMRPIAYQPFCGPPTTTTAAQATALAESAMIPYAPHPTMISPAMPDDVFVFYAAPSDLGGVVAVSARLGVSVFAASVVWGGGGQILLPTEWRDPWELADGCGNGTRIPRSRAYLLGVDAGAEAATVGHVIAAVELTVLPGALAERGTLLDAAVIGYVPGAAGAVDGPREWVVVVNGRSNE